MPVADPKPRLLRRTLLRYVVREAALPTAFAIGGLTLVVLTQGLLGFSDLVINRGFGMEEVATILFLQAIPVVATMLPFAVLVGILVALGRLGADREILAIESLGVPATRLVQPAALFALGMAVVSLGLHWVAAPWANRSLDRALVAFSLERPWAQIRAGQVQRFGHWALEVREASARGDRLQGVLLFVPDVGETVFARAGALTTAEDGGVQLQLEDGSVLLSAHGRPRQIRFGEMVTELPRTNEPVTRLEREQWAGRSYQELLKLARTHVPNESSVALNTALLHIHRRLALPVATLIFGVLAVPLFLARGSFSRAGGGVLGLVVTLAYYGLAQLGEGLAQAGSIGTGFGVWLPNLVVGVVALVLLVRVRRARVLGGIGGPRRAGPPGPARVRRGPRRFALARYVAARFARLTLLSFAILVVGYLVIDVMDRLEWFARHQATGLEILRFYGARFPLLASRVVPMSLLVGTALTVSLLGVDGELVGIRSCGIPAPRALLPVLAIAALLVPSYFLLNNEVVPRTNALADYLKETQIKEEHYARIRDWRKELVWFREGNRIVEAKRLDPDLGLARELTLYEIGSLGLPVARTDAVTARHVGNGVWRLESAERVVVDGDDLRHEEAPEFAELGQTVPSQVDTMHLPVGDLAREIEEVEANGYDATSLRVDLHVKLAAPLACLALPALVLFFALGGPPYPGPAQTLLASGIVGVGFILLTGVAASLGYGGTLPAAVGGWAPVGSAAALAGWLGVRVWRHS